MIKTVNRNKSGFFRATAVCLIGLYFFSKYLYNNVKSVEDLGTFEGIFILIAIIINILLLIIPIKQLLKRPEALIISNKGIEDYVSFANAGLIEWDNITSAEIDKKGLRNALIINLKNDFNLKKNTSFITQNLQQENVSKYGNALVINKDYIKGDLEEIKDAINSMKPKVKS